MRLMWSAGCSIVALFAVAGVRAATPDLALLEAIKNQNHDAVRTLIAGGADVNATQPDGATALHWAAYRDDVDLLSKRLLAHMERTQDPQLAAFKAALAKRSR